MRQHTPQKKNLNYQKMKNLFNSVQFPKVGSNVFNLSHDVKMSFKMGRLYPTCLMDVVPGDKIRLSVETMLRFAPLVSPVMHKVHVTTHFFFVPNRIIWPNWEKWITGDLDVEPPYITVDSMNKGTIGDYFGIPTQISSSAQLKVNALPFAAYAKIWNEYYRDQNLQDPIQDTCVDGLQVPGPEGIWISDLPYEEPLKRAWQHDYFTSALPFAQKGDSVTLPLGNFEDVNIELAPDFAPNKVVDITGPSTGDWNLANRGATQGNNIIRRSDSATTQIAIDPNNAWRAKTSDLEAQAADINTLRRAFRLQEWLERNARGGTRYIENILAHFGVKSSDARLNRPEYLGGSKGNMVISEVLSTAQTDDSEGNITNPVGSMAGHGISLSAGKEFSYRVEEHGWIIGLINVQPVTAYQQGIHRSLSRFDRLDYFWPSFANIGEQEIKNQEVFVKNNDQTYNEGTFGYIPRYSEYKYLNSRVAGDFRDTVSFWHLGRIFSSPPTLSKEFIEANPSDRIFAVQDDVDHIYGHIFNNIKAVRKMPRYGTPTI